MGAVVMAAVDRNSYELGNHRFERPDFDYGLRKELFD
jgi:hypothetical protein